MVVAKGMFHLVNTLWWTNVPIWMGGYFDFSYVALFQGFVSLTSMVCCF
jgi:hypothetical protein